MADAIATLARSAKLVSNGKIFTFSFYGYDLMAAMRLLDVPELDGICSTYDYVHATRNATGPFIPVIPLEALAVAGKLAIPEDDTRTQFAEPSCPSAPCVPWAQTANILKP